MLRDPYRIVEDEPEWLQCWPDKFLSARMGNRVEVEPPEDAIMFRGYELSPEMCARMMEVLEFRQKAGTHVRFTPDPKERERRIQEAQQEERLLDRLYQLMEEHPEWAVPQYAEAVGVTVDCAQRLLIRLESTREVKIRRYRRKLYG